MFLHSFLVDFQFICSSNSGTVLLPLYRGDTPLTRKIFAFWPESSDSSLQWEFAEVLRENIK